MASETLQFNVPPSDSTAAMLRADLKAAGIVYRDENGRVADFHCLRHSFITNLASGGIHPKVAQTLARHSTIGLTMDRYTHQYAGDEVAALDVLPDLDAPTIETAKATGTDGDTVQANPTPENLASCLAQSGTRVEAQGGAVSQLGNTSTSTENVEKQGETPVFQGEMKKPPVRLELTTCGLQNRCSTN
jgi:hypothetical protein